MSLPTLNEWKRICAEAPSLVPETTAEWLYDRLETFVPKARPPGQEALGFYISEYTRVRGSRPIFEPKDAKRLKQLVEMQGLERVEQLISTYLHMRDGDMVLNHWPLWLFLNKVSRVAQALDHGRASSKQESHGAERNTSNLNAFLQARNKSDGT